MIDFDMPPARPTWQREKSAGPGTRMWDKVGKSPALGEDVGQGRRIRSCLVFLHSILVCLTSSTYWDPRACSRKVQKSELGDRGLNEGSAQQARHMGLCMLSARYGCAVGHSTKNVAYTGVAASREVAIDPGATTRLAPMPYTLGSVCYAVPASLVLSSTASLASLVRLSRLTSAAGPTRPPTAPRLAASCDNLAVIGAVTPSALPLKSSSSVFLLLD